MLVCWCKNIRGGKPQSISQTRTEALELQNQIKNPDYKTWTVISEEDHFLLLLGGKPK